MGDPIIKQLDLVEILTTRNVSYLSARPGQGPSPQGQWTVIGIIEGEDILISKDEAIVRIPLVDVRKVGSYSIAKIENSLRSLRHGQVDKEGD